MKTGISIIVFKDGSMRVQRVASEDEHQVLLDKADVNQIFTWVFFPPDMRISALGLEIVP